MALGFVSLQWCLSLFFTIVTLLNAISFKCDQVLCVITELRTPQETFFYRYIPDDVDRVVYMRLLVHHVDAKILEGIGAGRAKHVSIESALKLQRLSLSSKCNIYFLLIQNTGLREIEFEENHKLEELKIISSSLASITPTIRLLKNLRKLHISWSLIQRLDLSIFCGHEKISMIYLGTSRIRSITSNNAESCPTPTEDIYSLHSMIDSVDLQLFNAFSNLRTISLNFNRIAALCGQFTSKTIRYLKLAQNKLQTLNICEWDTPNLKELILDYNLLASLPQCLENLKNLTDLQLSGNHIISVAIESFATMWSLTDLSLSRNNMTSVVLNSTHFPPQLKSLELDDNLLTHLNLSSIPVDNFSIALTHNLITNFDVNGTSSNVIFLSMACNPIDCTWYSKEEKKSAVCQRVARRKCNPKSYK